MLHFLRRKGGEFAAKILNGILILTISFSSLTYAMPIPVASAAAPVTIVLYSQSTYNNYSNFNDNGANSAYAWRWTPRTSGTPTEISLNVERTVGYPKGDICIRADKTATSASFGCVKGAIFFSGENSFALTDAAPVTAGTSYWVYFTRTSDANNYPSFRYTTSSAGAPLYRATASGIDPNYLWFSYDIAMTVKGVDSATAATTASSVPTAVLYSQLAQDDYSYFAYRGADERFAWEWTPTFDGTPAEISLFTEMVRGTPMGSICIRADKKAASASFGCSGIVTFKAGENVIPLTGGAPVKAGVKYWVYYTRTSAGTWENNFAAFQYRSSVAGKNKTYRSAVLGADPTDADYWFTYDIKMAIRGTLTSAVVFAPPASAVTATPAPTGKISELVLYNETGRGGYSNFNWNAGKDNYAWELHTIADGVPNQITLYTHHVTGTPTGDICIRAGLSTTSQSFGCAKNVTFKAGENVIPLVGGEKIVWRNGYYVHFTRTSDANNYPSFEYRYPVTDLPVYRATAANAEPTTRWLNYNIAMKISNVQVIEELPVFTPAPVLAYSQTQANNYSSFNWNAANDTYAWMWEPTEDVVPTQIIIPTERVTGTATGIFCIRATRAIDSLSYGCSADTRLKTGDNLITLTPTGAALSKLGVYYVHFTRTSGLDNFPSFKYLDTNIYYPVFRSEQANDSPSLKWFSNNITMTIRGTAPTAPTAESQMIYGLSRAEAQKVYDQLSTIPRSQGAIWAGRSNLAPRGFELAAKENPRYYYSYVFLIPERTAASYGGDTPRELIITYDELGAKLGKAPVTPWLGVTKTVDKTGYIYGMPRTEAEALYQVLKNEVYTPDSKMPLYLDAGKSEVIIGEGACVRDLRFRLAWNGLYRFGPGNVDGWLMLTKKEAEAKGFTDKTYEEAYADCLLSYHFLRPGFVANQYSTSVTSGINKVISFPAAEIPLAITFEQFEKTLGYPASGVLTPGLTYSANPSAFLVQLPTTPTPPAQITLTPAAYLPPIIISTPKDTKVTIAQKAEVAATQGAVLASSSSQAQSVVILSDAQRLLALNDSLFQPTANSTIRYDASNGSPNTNPSESAIQLCIDNKVGCVIAGSSLLVGTIMAATATPRISLSRNVLFPNATASAADSLELLKLFSRLGTYETSADGTVKFIPSTDQASVCTVIPSVEDIEAFGARFIESGLVPNLPEQVTAGPKIIGGVVFGVVAGMSSLTQGVCSLIDNPIEAVKELGNTLIQAYRAAAEVNIYIDDVVKGRTPRPLSSALSQKMLSAFQEFKATVDSKDYYKKGFSAGYSGFMIETTREAAVSGVSLIKGLSLASLKMSGQGIRVLSAKVARLGQDADAIAAELVTRSVPSNMARTAASDIIKLNKEENLITSRLNKLADDVDAASGFSYLRARAKLMAKHAYQQHVVELGEYVGIRDFASQAEFEEFIFEIMKNPTGKVSGLHYYTHQPRTIYWDSKTGTIIVDYGTSPTAFRPIRGELTGYSYYLDQAANTVVYK